MKEGSNDKVTDPEIRERTKVAVREAKDRERLPRRK